MKMNEMTAFELMEEIEQVESMLREVEQMKVSEGTYKIYRYFTNKLAELKAELEILSNEAIAEIDRELELHAELDNEFEYLELEAKREGWE